MGFVRKITGKIVGLLLLPILAGTVLADVGGPAGSYIINSGLNQKNAQFNISSGTLNGRLRINSPNYSGSYFDSTWSVFNLGSNSAPWNWMLNFPVGTGAVGNGWNTFIFSTLSTATIKAAPDVIQYQVYDPTYTASTSTRFRIYSNRADFRGDFQLLQPSTLTFGDSFNYIRIHSPPNFSGNIDYWLPELQGEDGQALLNSGDGNLYWGTISSSSGGISIGSPVSGGTNDTVTYIGSTGNFSSSVRLKYGDIGLNGERELRTTASGMFAPFSSIGEGYLDANYFSGTSNWAYLGGANYNPHEVRTGDYSSIVQLHSGLGPIDTGDQSSLDLPKIELRDASNNPIGMWDGYRLQIASNPYLITTPIPNPGSLEYDGQYLYFTTSSVRQRMALYAEIGTGGPGGDGAAIYPATGTPSFPYGLKFSTFSDTSNDIYYDGNGYLTLTGGLNVGDTGAYAINVGGVIGIGTGNNDSLIYQLTDGHLVIEPSSVGGDVTVNSPFYADNIAVSPNAQNGFVGINQVGVPSIPLSVTQLGSGNIADFYNLDSFPATSITNTGGIVIDSSYGGESILLQAPWAPFMGGPSGGGLVISNKMGPNADNLSRGLNFYFNTNGGGVRDYGYIYAGSPNITYPNEDGLMGFSLIRDGEVDNALILDASSGVVSIPINYQLEIGHPSTKIYNNGYNDLYITATEGADVRFTTDFINARDEVGAISLAPIGNDLEFTGVGDDNYYDIGHLTENRPKNIYVGTSINVATITTSADSGLLLNSIPYGEMYATNVNQTVTVSAPNTPYEITTGFVVGSTNSILFGSDHYLQVKNSGKYLAHWNMSVDTSIESDEVEGGLMINGVEQQNGTAHTTVPVASGASNIASQSLLNLAANDAVSLYVRNHSAARNIVWEHGSLILTRIGAYISPPEAPTGFALSTVTAESITFKWNPVSPTPDNYTMQISSTSTFISVTGSSTTVLTTATVSGLAPGTTYYGRANTNQGTLSSVWSSTASGTTTTIPPLPPGGYEEVVLSSYPTGLVAFYPLNYNLADASTNYIYPWWDKGGVTFSGPAPFGFKGSINSSFNGTSSQIRVENSTYPFQLAQFTISCWFKKTGNGTTTTTSGGADGFATGDPIVPLVTKGRGEAETPSNVNLNWFLGLNNINNGGTFRIGGDFEQASGGNHRVVGTTLISNNTWYFAAYTFNGTTGSIYLNGLLEGTTIPVQGPTPDSIQKMGIGSAYTSASVAAGFFQGHLAGVAIWNHDIGSTSIKNLYDLGMDNFRSTVTYVSGVNDNLITHGTNFANWTIDGVGSSKASTGVRVIGATGNFAKITVPGLIPQTTYWAMCNISSTSVSTSGQLRISSINYQGATISGPNNGIQNISTMTGRFYFKVVVGTSAAPHTLVIENANNGSAEFVEFSSMNVYEKLSRAAYASQLGDRHGGYDESRARSVDTAILADTDTINIIGTGDLNATGYTYYQSNSLLMSSIAARGGRIYPEAGNHDYDGTNETVIMGTFNATGYNNGELYYSTTVGKIQIFAYDDMNDTAQQPDNLGGINVSVSTNQISQMGSFILQAISTSTAKWPIFLIHHPPYGTIGGGGTTNNRWDFNGLGIPVVVSGHTHGLERLSNNNVNYFVHARGGCDHHGYAALTSDSVYRVNDNTISGFLKYYDTDTDLVIELYDTNNYLLDRWRIQRQ